MKSKFKRFFVSESGGFAVGFVDLTVIVGVFTGGGVCNHDFSSIRNTLVVGVEDRAAGDKVGEVDEEVGGELIHSTKVFAVTQDDVANGTLVLVTVHDEAGTICRSKGLVENRLVTKNTAVNESTVGWNENGGKDDDARNVGCLLVGGGKNQLVGGSLGVVDGLANKVINVTSGGGNFSNRVFDLTNVVIGDGSILVNAKVVAKSTVDVLTDEQSEHHFVVFADSAQQELVLFVTSNILKNGKGGFFLRISKEAAQRGASEDGELGDVDGGDLGRACRVGS